MHTPAGFEMRDGVAHATDWMAIVFNPSMPYRLTHMLIASGLTCAFLIAGLAAWRWLRDDRGPDVLAAMRTGVYLAATLIPIQILVGDLHGTLNTLEHQPAKVAAMEGNWETRGNVPLVLFAVPNEAERRNDFEIAVPNGCQPDPQARSRGGGSGASTRSKASTRRSRPCSTPSESWSGWAC
jgi:cytochrome d ubiquinol oxidase subunit I